MRYKEYILDNKRNKEYLQLQYSSVHPHLPLTPPRATARLETQGRREIYMTSHPFKKPKLLRGYVKIFYNLHAKFYLIIYEVKRE
uniref:Ovule protein n=1 Tax=Heterorhabditis bacteriophora TaxID=37862 RepID=A0A1I7WAM8_HETBA